MLKMLIMLFGLLIATPLFAQQDLPEAEVPQIVRDNYYNTYGTTNNVKWVRGENGNYVAVFVNDNFDNRITYDGAGVMVMREVEVDASTLPDPITKNFIVSYPKGRISSASVIEDDGGGKRYRIQYLNADETGSIFYNPDGTVYPFESK